MKLKSLAKRFAIQLLKHLFVVAVAVPMFWATVALSWNASTDDNILAGILCLLILVVVIPIGMPFWGMFAYKITHHVLLPNLLLFAAILLCFPNFRTEERWFELSYITVIMGLSLAFSFFWMLVTKARKKLGEE